MFSLIIGNARHSLTQKCIWLVILLTTVASVLPVVVFRFLKVNLYPTLSDQVCHSAVEYLKAGFWLLKWCAFLSYWKLRDGLMKLSQANTYWCIRSHQNRWDFPHLEHVLVLSANEERHLY